VLRQFEKAPPRAGPSLFPSRVFPGYDAGIFFALVALLVTVNAVSAMSGTGQLLLDRLDLIAETAALD